MHPVFFLSFEIKRAKVPYTITFLVTAWTMPHGPKSQWARYAAYLRHGSIVSLPKIPPISGPTKGIQKKYSELRTFADPLKLLLYLKLTKSLIST